MAFILSRKLKVKSSTESEARRRFKKGTRLQIIYPNNWETQLTQRYFLEDLRTQMK